MLILDWRFEDEPRSLTQSKLTKHLPHPFSGHIVDIYLWKISAYIVYHKVDIVAARSMSEIRKPRLPPSARWTSFDGWDYNGMKERLDELLTKLNKSALIRHAERIKGRAFTMSKPFSAGQYWICFELIADDGSLVIARVRLPRHPDTPSTISEEDELYSIACEVSTMQLVQQRLSTITIPRVYAYEGPGSLLAVEAGAVYMLLEGFYGNTLQDVAFDMCSLPVSWDSYHHILNRTPHR